MSSIGDSLGISTEDHSQRPTQLKLWLLFFLLAILLHFLIFRLPLTLPALTSQAPVEVHTISPEKLEAVRRQWREKSLLLDQKKKPSENPSEAPKDARYFSDRNIRVEKEQRARESAVVPKP